MKSNGQNILSIVVVLVVSSCFTSTASAQEQSTDNPFRDDQVAPASFEQLPPPSRKDMDAAFAASTEELRRSGILRTALNVGDKAPDFELSEAGGRNVKLSELWAVGPVVLVYYRGNWCPYCSRHLSRLQQSMQQIHAQDAQLVAISPETQSHALATEVKHRLTFPVLHDEQNAVARKYGVAYRVSNKVIPYYNELVNLPSHNGDPSYELPLAAAYVIDREGTIRYAFLDADFTRRADPADILTVLRRLKQTSPERPTTQPLARR